MKLKDIKTLITSGTVLLALALYMIFGNPPRKRMKQDKRSRQNLH